RQELTHNALGLGAGVEESRRQRCRRHANDLHFRTDFIAQFRTARWHGRFPPLKTNRMLHGSYAAGRTLPMEFPSPKQKLARRSRTRQFEVGLARKQRMCGTGMAEFVPCRF